MWLKTKDKQYVDLDNGTVLFVSRYHDTVNSVAGTELYRVQVESRNYTPKTLMDGYPTQDEAFDALDEFMSNEEFREIQPPVSDEETTDDETTENESTVDSGEAK